MSNADELIPQGRVMCNGDICFPREAPKMIAGYRRDPGNPQVFNPIIKPCIFRVIDWQKRCGGMIQIINCGFYKIKVKHTDCMVCTERKES